MNIDNAMRQINDVYNQTGSFDSIPISVNKLDDQEFIWIGQNKLTPSEVLEVESRLSFLFFDKTDTLKIFYNILKERMRDSPHAQSISSTEERNLNQARVIRQIKAQLSENELIVDRLKGRIFKDPNSNSLGNKIYSLEALICKDKNLLETLASQQLMDFQRELWLRQIVEQEASLFNMLCDLFGEISSGREAIDLKIRWRIQTYLSDLAETGEYKRDKEGNTILHYAASLGDTETLNKLKHLIPDKLSFLINQINDDGYSPLHIALLSKNWKMAKELIHEGANINDSFQNKFPILLHAFEMKDEELINFCLEQEETNLLERYRDGGTILHLAVIHNLPTVLARIIQNSNVKEHLADKNYYGETAWELALKLKNDECLKVLREEPNLNVQQLPGYGEDRINISQEHIIDKMKEYIEMQGGDPNELDLEGGQCNGLIFLASYYLDKGSIKDFFKILELISCWKGKEVPNELKEKNEVKELKGNYKDLDDVIGQTINDVVLFMHSLSASGMKGVINPLELLTSQAQSARVRQFEMVKEKKSDNLNILLPQTNMKLAPKQLVEMIRIWAQYPKTVIEITGAQHATCAYVQEDGKIFYYDPNFERPIARAFDSIDELVEVIQKSKYQALGKQKDPMDMSLQVYQHSNRSPVSSVQSPSIFDINSPSPNHFSALHKAVLLNNIEAAKDILANSQNLIQEKDDTDKTALNWAVRLKKNEIASLILSTSSTEHSAILQDLIASDNADLLRFILSKQDPQLEKDLYTTRSDLLVHAVQKGAVNCAKELLKYPIDNINLKLFFGGTALYYAMAEGNTEIVALLLQAGANPTIPAGFGNKTVVEYLRYDNLLAQLVVNNMQNVNDVDDKGNTFLHLAIKDKALPLCHMLIEKGINLDLKNREGKTVLDLAKEIGDLELISLLNSKIIS